MIDLRCNTFWVPFFVAKCWWRFFSNKQWNLCRNNWYFVNDMIQWYRVNMVKLKTVKPIFEYRLVIGSIAIETMAIERVSFPLENWDFPISHYVNVEVSNQQKHGLFMVRPTEMRKEALAQGIWVGKLTGSHSHCRCLVTYWTGWLPAPLPLPTWLAVIHYPRRKKCSSGAVVHYPPNYE